MDTSMRWGLVIAGLVMVGCGGPDETKDGEPVSDQGAALVFANDFADGGTLRVFEDSQKKLGIAVAAPIGSEAEQLLRESISAVTLEDIYLALHAKASNVPSDVRHWSGLIEAQKLEQTQRRDELSDARAAEPVPPVIMPIDSIDKSESAFRSGYCRNFGDFGTVYVPIECNWYPNTWLRTTPKILSSNGGSFIDRSYGWNATQWRSWMAALGSGNSWTPWVQPFTVIWVQWGGVYTGASVWLSIENGHGDAAGEMGLTIHDARPLVK
jgi:hypothetical protein